jgi:hypothetical protein
MRTRNSLAERAAQGTGMTMLVLVLVAALCSVVYGQAATTQTVAFTRAVGGISVDASGMLDTATVDWMGQLSRLRRESLQQIPAELNEAVPLRKVSLRRLEAALEECVKSKKPLPDEIKYLAGLQQVRYVFVYPEQRDIVLVGPGEGWKVDQQGNLVGLTTGRPVMLLDDLLVALRTARQAANGGITCSINPTSEGLARYASFSKQFGTRGNPTVFAAGAEKALGPQRITLTNVPPGSHFARVLVAADYRMKRLGMGFEPAPVRGLPSFLQMVRSTRNMMPRWWLEPNYDPLQRSPDGLAWELRGASVKAMTEEDFLGATGNLSHSGKADPTAQKWADNMTKKYDELAVALPIFGELRNCMELAIVGALVAKERLPDKAGYSMPVLLDPEQVAIDQLPAPKQVASKVSMVKKGRNWIISASGGVALNSWGVADKVQQSDAPASVRTQVAPTKESTWWWN